MIDLLIQYVDMRLHYRTKKTLHIRLSCILLMSTNCNYILLNFSAQQSSPLQRQSSHHSTAATATSHNVGLPPYKGCTAYPPVSILITTRYDPVLHGIPGAHEISDATLPAMLQALTYNGAAMQVCASIEITCPTHGYNAVSKLVVWFCITFKA